MAGRYSCCFFIGYVAECQSLAVGWCDLKQNHTKTEISEISEKHDD